MKQYKAIEELTNEVLEQAYLELAAGKLPYQNSVVRGVQSKVSAEAGKPVALVDVKYKLAMEYIARLKK